MFVFQAVSTLNEVVIGLRLRSLNSFLLSLLLNKLELLVEQMRTKVQGALVLDELLSHLLELLLIELILDVDLQ